jgi:hypothetical protein
MKNIRIALAFPCLLILVFSASSVFANGVRSDLSASGKGVQNADCAGTILDNPACFQFSVVSSTEATWEAFNLTDFETATFTTIGPYNLFMINGIVSGTQVTFTLPGATDAFGSFFCGDDPNMASISAAGFCSDPTNALFEDASGIFSQVPPLDVVGNEATYIFNGTGPTSWVFYGSPGATVSTSNGSTNVPEPSTLMLLVAGAGLLAFAKLRRA